MVSQWLTGIAAKGMPAGAPRFGLAINVDRRLATNQTLTLTIDFDADKSIVQQGNGGYTLKPVLSLK